MHTICRSTLQLKINLNILYIHYYTLLKNAPSLFKKAIFLTKKKQQNAPLACEVCVFLTERNLELRQIAGKARAARSRCACGAYLYIQILDTEMSYFTRWLLRSVWALSIVYSLYRVAGQVTDLAIITIIN